MKSRVYTYKGKSITVTFDVALCTHVAECLRGLPGVFASFERPWVKPDEAPPDDVARIIEKCPTGALQYRRTDGGPQETIPSENRVQVLSNGPYYLTGNIELQNEEGHATQPVPASHSAAAVQRRMHLPVTTAISASCFQHRLP